MPKFSVDYSNLDSKFNKKIYKLSEVQDKIEKVAFDVVRFKDADKGADLWQIQSSNEGDYIVSLYQEDENGEVVKTASSKCNWEVNNIKGGLQFFYKGDPIAKVAYASMGLTASDASNLEKHLPQKMSTDKKLVKMLLNQVDSSSKEIILNKYPELA